MIVHGRLPSPSAAQSQVSGKLEQLLPSIGRNVTVFAGGWNRFTGDSTVIVVPAPRGPAAGNIAAPIGSDIGGNIGDGTSSSALHQI